MKGMVAREILLLLVMFWNLENFFDPFAGNYDGFVQGGVVDTAVNTVGLQNKRSLRMIADMDTAAQMMVKNAQKKQNKGRRQEVFAKEPFTPKGEKFWTWKKFSKKRDDIARTVALVGERYGLFPAIIGLCEVENRFVLQQLTQNTILSGLNYSIIHKDSPDRRGIDAALIYRKELFSPRKVQFIPIRAMDTLRSREMVYVKGVFRKLDTLHCFVVHWPSKLGGEKESVARRMAASNTLKQITDSILLAEPRANIIVMGDFNDGMESEPLANVDNLVNMSREELAGIGRSEIRQEPYGWFSYKYKESWSRIDHFLISRNLCGDSMLDSSENSLKYLFCTRKSSKVFWHDFLLEEDKLYLGYKIRRTLTGPRYNGGVSDHLPIILEVWGYGY